MCRSHDAVARFEPRPTTQGLPSRPSLALPAAATDWGQLPLGVMRCPAGRFLARRVHLRKQTGQTLFAPRSRARPSNRRNKKPGARPGSRREVFITRLTAEWQSDYGAWQTRDLSARRYIYVWADGAGGPVLSTVDLGGERRLRRSAPSVSSERAGELVSCHPIHRESGGGWAPAGAS
jgi:hypothetical protein